MGKATLMTPLYVSVSWTMMVTYQIFTQTAVSTVLTFFNSLWPTVGEWLILRMDLVIFIYAFSWVFVLASVIPSVLLGKERSVLVQFFISLILTLIAFIVQNSVNAYMGNQSQVLLGATFLFGNPLFAVIYLSTPYALMLAIDIRARGRRKREEQFGRIKTTPLELTQLVKQDAATQEASVCTRVKFMAKCPKCKEEIIVQENIEDGWQNRPERQEN